MTSNLDPRMVIENDTIFRGNKVKKIVRICCGLCGDVINMKVEHYNDKIDEYNLMEFHTSCSE